jgi:hypothetical protein
MNVLGDPVDNLGDIPGERVPIHQPAPSLADTSVSDEPLVTGIKVVDLLAPYPKGGKVGMLRLLLVLLFAFLLVCLLCSLQLVFLPDLRIFSRL